MHFCFDTETFLITPARQAPPVVCLQWWDGLGPVLNHANPRVGGDARDIISEAIRDRETLIGHNVAYDLACIAETWPEFLEPVFRAYMDDRVVCTQMIERLIQIATHHPEQDEGGKEKKVSLAHCSHRYKGPDLNKADPWRLKYGTLYDMPLKDWPTDAVHYACQDATAQHHVYHAQIGQYETVLEDRFRQARAAWWMHLMSAWGMRTNSERVHRYMERIKKEIDEARAVAQAAELVRPSGKRNTKAAMKRMVSVMNSKGIAPLVTVSGKEKQLSPEDIAANFDNEKYIQVTQDACTLADDPALSAYQLYGSAKGIYKRLERLEIGTRLPLQARFNPLVNSGRTSCSMGKNTESAYGFQLQNIPRDSTDGGMHGCFEPRPGFMFAWADLDGIELRSWAQSCLWLIGRSRMAEVLNAGIDPHTDLGSSIAGISREEAEARMRGERGKELKAEFKSKFRQTAKIGNFGFQGGMGPAKLREQARTGYGVTMTLDEARHLHKAWKQTWPEAEPYLQYIGGLLDETKGYGKITQLKSNRVRNGVYFCEAANGYFQGLTADATKAAGFMIAFECYCDPTSPLFGSRIVNFVHDEYVLEVPIAQASVAAHRLVQIMCTEIKKWMPDVPISATPVLGYRWSKSAESKRDSAGQLIPWDAVELEQGAA